MEIADIQTEYIKLRWNYYNSCKEDIDKFEKKFGNHPLYEVTTRHLYGSIKDVFDIAKVVEADYRGTTND